MYLLRSLGHQNLLRFDPEPQVRLRQLGATLLEVSVEGHEASLIHEHGPQRSHGVLQPHDLGEGEYRAVVVVSLNHAAEEKIQQTNTEQTRGSCVIHDTVLVHLTTNITITDEYSHVHFAQSQMHSRLTRRPSSSS